MEYKRSGNKIIARLDRGERIMPSLTEIAVRENIQTGSITAIGAVDCAQLNYYYVHQQNYKTTEFNDDFEVVSLNGNITQKGNEPHLHIHTVLSGVHYSTIGGHLLDATVSVTLEVFIEIADFTVKRVPDETLDNFMRMSFE